MILATTGAFALKRALGPRPAPVTASAPSGAALDLTYAEFRDLDGSGDATAGDEVVLQLAHPLPAGADVPLSTLALASTDDSWGEGALVQVGANRRKAVAAGPPREIHVVLGRGARLRLYGTYRPGTAGAMPAQVRAAGGPLPVLVRGADRREFVGDRFPDAPDLKPYYGQLHAHTSFSDGVLQPHDAYAMARQWGLDFFAVTDHLEQIPRAWDQERSQADAATADGAFVALAGFEWGGAPSAHGWINHVNVLGSDALLGLMGTMSVSGLYEGIDALPGAHVVGQFNHPGMEKPVVGRNNWDGFAYSGAADRRMKQIMVATRSPSVEDNRETMGYIPALDQGWHLSPKGEEDNHTASWGRTRVRTGLWMDALTRDAVLAALTHMASFYTDDPDASVKLVADGRWLMGSTVYGAGPHHLEVEVRDRRRVAAVGRIEIVTRGGAVLSTHPGGATPLHVAFDVTPESDTYYFARVVLEQADVRLLSAPVFVDR